MPKFYPTINTALIDSLNKSLDETAKTFYVNPNATKTIYDDKGNKKY